MTVTTAPQITFTAVEPGFARVVIDGRTYGKVIREKHGSTRTGTRWFAMLATIEVGSADTREAAAQLLADRFANR